MNVAEIKSEVMFQTNNDEDDLGDFLPWVMDYINEGYDRLVYAFVNQHVSSDNEEYPFLKVDKAQPNLPEFVHRYIADYATYLVYRNGNVQKQNRGQKYLERFLEVESQLKNMTDDEKAALTGDENFKTVKYGKKFINIPW